MTQKSWPWSTVAALGDGAAELNEADSRAFLALWFGVQDPTIEGVSKGVGGELAVSGVASPLTVQSGSAICYGLFINDAAASAPAIASPAVGTTGGRVVLQTNWAGTGGGSLEARTRIAVKKSADGVAAIPALTQSFGVTWEISLATFTITTGGVITVTDARNFRKSTAVVGNAELTDSSVSFAKIGPGAATSVFGRSSNSSGVISNIVAAANDRLLARVGDVLGFVQLTIGMIPDALITEVKLAAAVIAKLVTNGNSHDHIGGDGATIAAGALAADSVDDTKAGDRVPQFYRRQGGSATDWSAQGTGAQTPTAVRMQAGVIRWTGAAAGDGNKLITFPVAFSNTPIVFLSSAQSNVVVGINSGSGATAADVMAQWHDYAGGVHAAVDINWLAIGPE